MLRIEKLNGTDHIEIESVSKYSRGIITVHHSELKAISEYYTKNYGTKPQQSMSKSVRNEFQRVHDRIDNLKVFLSDDIKEINEKIGLLEGQVNNNTDFAARYDSRLTEIAARRELDTFTNEDGFATYGNTTLTFDGNNKE